MVEGIQQDAEFRTFCLALGDQLRDEELRGRITSPSWDGIRFFEAAQRHRVEQLLLAAIKRIDPSRLPAAFLKDLRSEARIAATRSLMQIRETARLAQAFAHADIPLIALKGVSLSVQTNRNPSLRNSRDVDLLVDPNRVVEADEILKKAGYHYSGPRIPRPMGNTYRRWSKEREYFHPENGTFVELHYRVSDNKILLDYDFERLWQEREIIEIGGCHVAVMSRKYLALYLCLHGALHGWERLCWLIDFAAALALPGAMEEALESATDRGLTPPLLQAILLAHDWLGFQVRDDLLARARSCHRVRALSAVLKGFYGRSAWYREPPRGSLAGFMRYSVWLRLYLYSLKPDWRYRRSQLAREFVAPADWTDFPLPKGLFWLYPVIRPVGWLVRRLIRIV